ncbi:cyclophilin-like fold protein [Desertivirga brevis]|uniref:cyclophilin-like fold protein n=1 Tax=Desertivirga brevis TaxID=2810310 RepID=UPI001A9631B3|nr:cyclophilin-like fold protein [Pedobacter sp. SYSU D00873]
MKRLLILVFCVFSLFSISASCDKGTSGDTPENSAPTNPDNAPNTNTTKMKIKIGNSTFTATLYENATTAQLRSLLPLTADMIELNGNEKYIDLPGSLPSSASKPGTIQAGDIMLYGSSTLVLFYKSFPTSYSYTRIGRIDDPTGLASALGSGNVRVRYEL